MAIRFDKLSESGIGNSIMCMGFPVFDGDIQTAKCIIAKDKPRYSLGRLTFDLYLTTKIPFSRAANDF